MRYIMWKEEKEHDICLKKLWNHLLNEWEVFKDWHTWFLKRIIRDTYRECVQMNINYGSIYNATFWVIKKFEYDKDDNSMSQIVVFIILWRVQKIKTQKEDLIVLVRERKKIFVNIKCGFCVL